MLHRQTKIRALLSVFGIAFALLLGGWWLIHPAYAAAEHQVVCPADGDGPEGMLRSAILTVNAMAEFDSIVISVTGADCLFTLVETAGSYNNGVVGLPLIERDLLIRAVGGRAIIERGDNASEFRLLESAANLTVENLTFRNGKPKYTSYDNPGSGGAIYAHQALTLTNVIFTDNESYRGGAVYVAGSLVMNQVTASHNRTFSARPSHGGAIAVEGDLTAVNITVTHNIAEDCYCGGDVAHGGGIYVGASADISAAVFHDNRSVQNSGGGLHVTGDLTLSNSDFVSNSARSGGGINVIGDLTLSSSDFVSNSSSTDGGGVYVNGTLALSDVRFIRNVAAFSGGGLASYGINEIISVTVEASSFISNQAQYGGGVVFQSGIVRNSLFEDNKAYAPSLLGGGALVAFVQATIENNHFVRNTAFSGGAVQILFYPPDASSDVSRIINNLLVDNGARDGAAISIGVDVPGFQGDHAVITHNTIVRQMSNNDSALYIVKR